MKYPSNLNLGGSAPFIVMMYYNWVAANKQSQKTMLNYHKEGAAIILPVPESGLGVSDSHGWEQQSGLLHKFNTEGLAEKGINMGKQALENSVGESNAGFVRHQTGMYANTYDSLNYSGPELREFNFGWTFYPHSARDSETLKSIIEKIRYRAMPTTVSMGEMRFPDFWKISVHFGGQTTLMKVKNCVLTSIEVDYSGEGVPRIFSDGNPVSVKLNLSFKELQRDSREVF